MRQNYHQMRLALEAGTLDPEGFTHGDHVGVAYEILLTRNFMDGAMHYARCIQALAAKAGAPEKYNTTITLAFLSLIAERMNQKSYASAEDFLNHNRDLLQSSVLKQWYSPARLDSDLARSTFLLPEPIQTG